MECYESLSPEVRDVVFRRVWVTGGLSNTPGLTDRLQTEIREALPSDYAFQMTHIGSQDFHIANMRTAATAADVPERVVTKKTYEEYGSYVLSQTLF